ncbi:hypothetical protein ACQBAU_08445 [Propionibacteriaceae bacterium Y2011]|uniref:hypothetical protein n=1 Tax=Microlunatus sp. Y2014 TaxID=3418488 RepID=UPI003B476EDF
MNATAEQPVAALPAGHVPSEDQAAAMRVNGQKALVAGFVGAHILAVPTLIVLGITLGRAGMVTGALGAVVVLLYRIFGQMITNNATRQPVGSQLATAMGSLLLRMTALLVLLGVWFALPAEVTAPLEPIGIALGILAAELGWMGALIVTGIRARMPIYDLPASTFDNTGSSASGRREETR